MPRTLLVFIGALAVLTGWWYHSQNKDFITNDTVAYVAPAANLLSGRGFVDRSGDSDILITPGYPLLIVPFLAAQQGLGPLILFQNAGRVVLALITAQFAFRINRAPVWAALAGIFFCFDLPTMESANQVMTETFFTLGLTLVLWLLWTETEEPEKHWSNPIPVGFLAGALVLIRPIALFFDVPAAAYLLLARRKFRFRATACFVLAFVCLPALWAARNYAQSGLFVVSTVPGVNMYFYRAAGALAIADPGDFQQNLERREGQFQKEACDRRPDLFADPCPSTWISREVVDEYFFRHGLEVIAAHPLGYLRLALHGAAMIMLGGAAERISSMTGIDYSSAVRLSLAYTVPWALLAIVGLLKLWGSNRRFFWLAGLTVSYFVAASAGAEAYSRYRVPIMPVYVVLIAVGASVVWGRAVRPGIKLAVGA
jgi:hypothetical protein